MASSFRCICCSFKADSLESLEGHIASDHLKYFPYQCFYCSYVRLPTEYYLEEHMRTQHSTQEIKTIYCPDLQQKRVLAKLLATCGGGKLQKALPPPSEASSATGSEANCWRRSCDAPNNGTTNSVQQERPMPSATVEITELRPLGTNKKRKKSAEGQKTTKSPKKKTESKASVSPKKRQSRRSDVSPRNQVAKQVSENSKKKSEVEQGEKASPIGGQLSCSLCERPIIFANTVKHILSKHFEVNTVFCGHCPFANKGNPSNMRIHNKFRHPDSECEIIDRRMEYFDELYKVYAECFPGSEHRFTRTSFGFGAFSEKEEGAGTVSAEIKVENLAMAKNSQSDTSVKVVKKKRGRPRKYPLSPEKVSPQKPLISSQKPPISPEKPPISPQKPPISLQKPQISAQKPSREKGKSKVGEPPFSVGKNTAAPLPPARVSKLVAEEMEESVGRRKSPRNLAVISWNEMLKNPIKAAKKSEQENVNGTGFAEVVVEESSEEKKVALVTPGQETPAEGKKLRLELSPEEVEALKARYSLNKTTEPTNSGY